MSEQLRSSTSVLILFLALALSCVGCGAPEPGRVAARAEGDVLLEAHPDGGLCRVRGRGMRMDTFVEITAYVPIESFSKGRKAVLAAFSAMAAVEARCSRYMETSELSQVNAMASTAAVTLSPELWELLSLARREGERLQGRFDPTVGGLLDAWNFGAIETRLPDEATLGKALAGVGLDGLRFQTEGRRLGFTRPGTVLDLGGYAKGHAIDEGARALRDSGITIGLVNAGGDMIAMGEKPGGRPWNIGLQDPDDPQALLGTFPLKGGEAVATSGDYERYFEVDGKRYHHLLDPLTGRPGRKSRSVTIVATSAALADLEATALFLEGPEALKRLEKEGRVAMVVDPKGRWHATPPFRRRFDERRRQ